MTERPAQLDPETFADIWAINRYQVICNRTICGQWVDRVIARDLTHEAAVAMADVLQDKYNSRHPNQSSWTKRHYWHRVQPPVLFPATP